MVLHWADWCWSAGGITDQAVERNCGRLILVRTVCRDSVGTEHCAGSLMSGKIKNIFIIQWCLSKSKTFGRRFATLAWQNVVVDCAHDIKHFGNISRVVR